VEDGGEILLRCGSSADDDDVKTRFAASAIRASDDCSNLEAMVSIVSMMNVAFVLSFFVTTLALRFGGE
jgi:hypothetical protein